MSETKYKSEFFAEPSSREKSQTTHVEENFPIRCPYCGSVLDGVENYRNYFLSRWHVYDHIYSIPFENSKLLISPLSFLSKLKFDQRTTVECQNCNRYYSLLLFPFERNLELKDQNQKVHDEIENSNIRSSYILPLEKCSNLFSENSVIGTFFRSFLFSIIISAGLIFFMAFLSLVDLSAIAPLLLIVCSLTIIQAFLIVLFQKNLKFFRDFFDLEKTPFLLSENCRNTASFFLFFKTNIMAIFIA